MFELSLHAYVRALMSPGVRVGPFLASFDAHDAEPYRNYAVPDDGAEPTADDVAALVTAFTERSRRPRLEFLPTLVPAVEPALLAAGFSPEMRLPVMTPGAPVQPPEPAGVEVRPAITEADLWAVADAQNEAYGAPPAAEHDVARLRGTLAGGGLVALAVDRSDGRGVGGGLCAPPHAGVSELAAIGVRASHRRRGIAAALTWVLTAACPAAGITAPFLTPAGTDEERIYRRAGYTDAAEMLHISR